MGKIEYDNISKDLMYFERKMYQRYAELEHAKLNNEMRERIAARCERLGEIVADLKVYYATVKKVAAAIDTEDRDYKNRRLGYLNSLITDSLAKIFPDKSLQACVECDFDRKNIVTLTLTDKYGNELDPDICSGKLQQYLISFASVAGIASGLGINNLYVDEAFGVAAPEILGEIGQVIQHHVDNGMQIVIISQNPGLYQDLPRHEIRLKTNTATSEVIVESEIDY